MVRLLLLNCDTDRWHHPETYSKFLGIRNYANYYPAQNKLPSEGEIRECEVICIPGSDLYIHNEYPWMEKIYKVLDLAKSLDKILIGFCYGHQLICSYLGAKTGILDTPHIGDKGIVLTPLGRKLIGRQYILTWSYHTNFVSDIAGTNLVSLCRFSNDFCIGYNKKGEVKIITVQYHPEFRFHLRADQANLLPNGGQLPYIKYNRNIRRALRKCQEEGCEGTNVTLEAFQQHYLHDREDINKLYYMYMSSVVIRRFMKRMVS